jgi:hypothetical protein
MAWNMPPFGMTLDLSPDGPAAALTGRPATRLVKVPSGNG